MDTGSTIQMLRDAADSVDDLTRLLGNLGRHEDAAEVGDRAGLLRARALYLEGLLAKAEADGVGHALGQTKAMRLMNDPPSTAPTPASAPAAAGTGEGDK